MDGQEPECIDPERGAEFEQIEMSAGDPGELASGYHQDDPGFLGVLVDHWTACESCQIVFPGAMDLVSAIREGVASIALHRIEDLAAEYATEFPESSFGNDNDQRHADRLAALASNYSARLNWELSFLLPIQIRESKPCLRPLCLWRFLVAISAHANRLRRGWS